MSVSCKGYIGYAVNLKNSLNSDDFRFFEEFEEKHSEYNQYDCKGKVRLIVDGMDAQYAKLIYVEEYIEECWIEGRDYFSLKGHDVPDCIYNELNKAYKILYNKELDRNTVDYSLFFHFV